MKFRWPWDHSEADRHAERVAAREVKVEAIYRQAKRQKRENHIGPLLETLFTTPPKDRS